jgi:cullin-4
VIKPFKVQPKLPENFETETWNNLKSAISNVYNKNASSLSKEELYRVIPLLSLDFSSDNAFLLFLLVSQAVEDLCVHKLASNLYESLHKELHSYIKEKVLALSKSVSLSSFLAFAFSSRFDVILRLN